MRSVRSVSALPFFGLLASCLGLLLFPQRSMAQSEESVPVTYAQYTQQTTSGGFTNCHSQIVGSHADPVGRGRDSDYEIRPRNAYAGSTPAAWTGAEDVAGVEITFLGSAASSSTPTPIFRGCSIFSSHAAAWGGRTAEAYYTPPKNKPPTACFTYQEADELRTITFDASCSADSDGEVVSYDWDFGGDGTGGGGVQARFTYDEAGTYTVTLTVRDDDGDEDSASRNVDVDGPAMRYDLSLEELTETAGKRLTDEEPTVIQVGDSVLVRVAVENTGDFPLENIQVTGGEAGIEMPGDPEAALAFVRAEREMIGRLEPEEADTLLFIYRAVHVLEEGTVAVRSVEAEAVAANEERHPVTETTEACSTGKHAVGPDADSDGCSLIAVRPAPFVVNSTGDAPLDDGLDPAEDGCSTGETILRDGEPEAECTLRAAMQVAAAIPDSEIRFDIPEDKAVHRIAPEGEAFVAVSGPITLRGPSADGTPVEIDGSGLGGGIGFELGSETGSATVEALAFYGFPNTVLAVRGRGSIVTGSRFGSDWAGSYTSTDTEGTDPLRNGGPALLISGDETRVGGAGGEGNLIIGSTIGIFVDGAWDVEILGNDIGVLESPHEQHGIELHNADRAIVGTFQAGNRINYNLEYGILVDEATSQARIQNNEIIRSRKDGILVRQGAGGSDPTMIGGAKEGDGNTIERSLGAGIRVTGSGGSAGGEAALLIQGNTLRENEEVGIRLEGGSAVLIGGAAGTPGTGTGNDIEDGIQLDPGRSVWVQGNRIANLDPETGYSTGSAIYVSGTNNVIGAEDDDQGNTSEGNVIYGVPEPDPDEDNPNDDEEPSGFGIWDDGTTTTIRFNMVGTEGPLYTGVVLNGTNARVLENTLSGNSYAGLSVRASATIEGNYIGVTPTGNGAMPNGGPGIEVFTQAVIGGAKNDEACERPCNVISGNEGPGILIREEASGTRVQGNMIGVGVDGRTHVGNGESGIVALADGVTIGGDNDIELLECKGPCNIIAANHGDGIRNFEVEEYPNLSSSGGSFIRGAGAQGASGFTIMGNLIGTGLPIPGSGNAGHGIALGALGSNHRVGGTGTGEGNLISGNGGAGVIVLASTEDRFINVQQWMGGQGNSIRGNRIVGIGSVPIDLYSNYLVPGGDGWNALDTADRSYGPNTMLNWPYLVESGEGDAQGSDLLVLWTGPPDASTQTYSLDIYTNAGCRGATGEAGNYLVSRDVTFPIGGGANVNAVRVDVPLVSSMPFYTATLTDSQGNTSELSNCRRAGQRPQQALQNVEVGIRTHINRLLLTLNEGGEAASKSLASLDLLVLAFDEAEGESTFEETAARTPAGEAVVPQSTQGAYWEIVAPEAPGALNVDVCLDASDVSALEDALVLGRGAATNGAWRPFDTRLETVEGVDYACADGLTTPQLTLGSGSPAVLAAPTLIAPANNTAGVRVGETFTWAAVAQATRYDFQIALDASFAMLLHAEPGIAGTTATPTNLVNNQRHYWRVRGVTAAGEAGPWSVPFQFATSNISVDVEGEPEVPAGFMLEANYPNPFNPQTTIGFTLPHAADVRLAVYDVLGREVARLVEGTRPAGRHMVVFDAGRLPSGVYLYRLEAGTFVQSRRMLLLK